MKNKLEFAIDRAMDAAKELIKKEIHHLTHGFNLNNHKIDLPINLSINYDNDGLMKFRSRVTYKQTVETDFEYDPDQQEFDFTFPGSNFGKLDLQTEGEADPTEDPAETSKIPTKEKPKKTDAAEKPPELFS